MWRRVNAYFGPSEGFSSIPKEPGNYAIYTHNFNSKPILRYIGTAKNLSIRLNKHEVIRVLRALSDDNIFIKCCIVKDKNKRLLLESKLISRIKPGVNNVK